jgi:GT2 family glycosyltransferase
MIKLSYVIVTHQRREPLLRTLEVLNNDTPLPKSQWEAWVVDNGSTDGTVEAVRSRFPGVHLIQRPGNEGVWARSYAFGPARGGYLILLDDDSYPLNDAAGQSIAYLDARPHCAAVVGRVVLPDGSLEACAMPSVMLSGAVCLRKSVTEKVGGFRREFFRKAGEYDFSFRIWEAGYSIERFEDVVYRHDKFMGGRSSSLAHRMDLRNNLILAERYLPAALRAEYRRDWSQRYAALATGAGFRGAARAGLLEAKLWRLREAAVGRQTLSADAIESIFGLRQQAQAIAAWSRAHGIRRVAIADFAKTLFTTYRGCADAGLAVSAIADQNPAFARCAYRGVPVLNDADAIATEPDGVVIANVNPAQVDAVERRVRNRFAGPVLRLWEPKYLGARNRPTKFVAAAA